MLKSKMNDSQVIESYLVDLLNAVSLLHENKLHAQSLTIILSAIDSFGLLDAPDSENKASGKLFKAWVNKYFCQNPGIEYTAEDLLGVQVLSFTYLHNTIRTIQSKKG